MLVCSQNMNRCSSPQMIELVIDKLVELGGNDLLRTQLTKTDQWGYNCLMCVCDFRRVSVQTSPTACWEMVDLIIKKIVEIGGPELVKLQLAQKSESGCTCLTLSSDNPTKCPEVSKLIASMVYHFGLLQRQYDDLSSYSERSLNEAAGVYSSSWTPDAATLAEVKKLLAGVSAKKRIDETKTAALKKDAKQDANAAKTKDEQSHLPVQKKKKKAAEDDDGEVKSTVFFDSPPPARCFKRGVPDKNLEDAVNALFSIKDAPSNRPDLKNWIPDKEDASSLLHYLNTTLSNLKERPAIKKLIAENGLTDDDIKILHSYKIQNPYPVYLWLNGWLGGDRRDDFIKQNVAPFFTLLYRAMEKLPKMTTVADRAVKVDGIASLKNTYDHYERVCAPKKTLSFWGFSSFSTKSDVVNREEFVGKPSEEAIVYSCGELEGVDMEPFAPQGLKNESEILPLCPCVLEVTTSLKIGQKLVVSVKQLNHADFSYVTPQ